MNKLNKAHKRSRQNKYKRRFIKSVWLLPTLLGVILILLTTLRISGSSTGIYTSIFYGTVKDPNLLLNQPQPIRSDEWLVTTQLTIAQKVAGFPRVNPNIDSGRDMSVVGDAPNKDWSTIFRPQNWSFFIMPFENAFAFKWWLLLYLVIVSCYFFTLRILPDRRLFSSLFSLAIGLSPFLFWWYQTGTLACIFYGFFILIISMRIINGEKISFLKNFQLRYSYIANSLMLAYLLVSFALILYPPFQIPVAIVSVLFAAGMFIDSYGLNKKLLSRESLIKLGTFVAALAIAGLIILTFFQTRRNVISAVTNTVYPGKRTVQTEGSSGYEILSTFVQPQLQRISRAANYYTNQSEASNFILLMPFLFIPALAVLFAEYRQKHRLNWALLSIQICIALFLAYLFIPVLQPIYKLFALNKVANARLFIGLGFVGTIQLLLIIKSLDQLKISKRKLNVLAAAYTLICLLIIAAVGHYARTKYPGFIHSILLIGFFGIFFCAIIFCFTSRRQTLGVILLLLFSIGSVFRIHPLYRGLGPAYNGAVIQAMDKISGPGDTWATTDSLYYENFALLANRDSFSGIKPYPDLKFWRQVDGPKDDHVYNRYAHVLFNPDISEDFTLIGPDSFQVHLTCNSFIEKNLDYALTTHALSEPCMKYVQEVHYPATTFYIYKIQH